MELVVIADDLTGANATGVKLDQIGLSTATVVSNQTLPNDQYDALCFDTDSRYDESIVANEKVKSIMETIEDTNLSPTLYSKRIDSTLRGNLGAEIDAMLDYLDHETVAIVVPSYPKSERVSVGGYLLVNGVPLEETEVAQDPVKPIHTSKVNELVEVQSMYDVATIELCDVLKGNQSIKQAIQSKADQGFKIITIDAVTDEEIENVAQASAQLNNPVLTVDPGPFTSAFANEVLHQQQEENKYILTIGSVTPVTQNQIQYFTGKYDAKPVYVDPAKLASFTDSWQEEVNRAIDVAKDRIAQENFILITTNEPSQTVLDLNKLATTEKVSKEKLAKQITDGLAAITYDLANQPYRLGGFYFSGGDLTASICHIAKAEGIKLEGEVLPLASYGKLIGGELANTSIVTKGGLIGDKKAIVESIKYLQTINSKGVINNAN
ncbi:four-carbon acid sugar kinase family protein [Alkalibacillus almallahensis]|uniref:four-carbon acid sugar kinase family protein n=1 Tax=Alkalibacillus almallahensis TaxID=1379154 RepID=UPI00141E1618|nr:four-carbon acid sugar kinase family protein [Alkalibacillus almallahensis]NIK13293.1 uncharacterized protein YgbK (DUF1537 family) [Alkalibacillus almallahensis]